MLVVVLVVVVLVEVDVLGLVVEVVLVEVLEVGIGLVVVMVDVLVLIAVELIDGAVDVAAASPTPPLVGTDAVQALVSSAAVVATAAVMETRRANTPTDRSAVVTLIGGARGCPGWPARRPIAPVRSLIARGSGM